MTQAGIILRSALRDGLRSRIVYGFGAFFLFAGWMMVRLGGAGDKALLSLLSLSLALVPLVSLVYGASYLYQSRRFIELLLAQPVPRRTLFLGLYAGLSLPLTLAWLLGCLLPLLSAGRSLDVPGLLLLLGAGSALCLANPIDLARVLVLLHFDLGAMMGYTGAVFQLFFQGPLGMGLAALTLLLWILLPLWLAWRAFSRRDF